MIPKPDKDARKKKTRPITIINVDTKILDKILGNQIQQYIKGIVHHEMVGFILGMQLFSKRKSISTIHHIKRMKDKNYTNHFNRDRKTIDGINIFVTKTLDQIGIEVTFSS